jgi:hypothetical protein
MELADPLDLLATWLALSSLIECERDVGREHPNTGKCVDVA